MQLSNKGTGTWEDGCAVWLVRFHTMSPRIKTCTCCQCSRQHTCRGNGYIEGAANPLLGVLIQCPRLLAPSAISGKGNQSTKKVYFKFIYWYGPYTRVTCKFMKHSTFFGPVWTELNVEKCSTWQHTNVLKWTQKCSFLIHPLSPHEL